MAFDLPSYGLLGAGSGMLGASGPSPYPTSVGQVFGAGLSGFLRGIPADLQEQRRQQMQGSLKQISDQLKAALGRDPTEADLGLAHRFGVSGAIALLRSPRNQSVANVLPDAVKANPQWAQLSVNDVISNTADAAGGIQQRQSPSSSGLLGDTSTPVTSGGGLADLLGGGSIAPQPYGAGLENMTPQMRQILSIALQDPTLGPQALSALLQVAAPSPRTGGMTVADFVKLQQGQQKVDVQRQRLEQEAKQSQQARDLAERKFAYEQQEAIMTPAVKDAIAQGLKQGTPEFNEYIRVRTTQGSPESIAAAVAAATAKQQAQGANKKVQESWDAAIDGGTSARSTLDQLHQLDMLNKQIHTGAFAGTTKDVLNMANSLGIDPKTLGISEKAAPYEAFQAIASNMAMHLRNPPGAANLMPGQMSNYEDQLLQRMGPELRKTPLGNQLLIDVQKRIQNRALAYQDFAVNYLDNNNGVVGTDWFKKSRDWWAQNPLMTPELQQRFDTISQSSNAAASDQEGKPASSVKRWRLQGGQLVPE